MAGGITVRAEALSCARGGLVLFANLSFRAEAGALVEISGPNGSGKTTLLRAIAGLVRPEAGRIAIERPGADEGSPCVHLIGHQDGIKGQLSARENLDFAAALSGRGAASKEALARAGLAQAADLPAHFLSAGQKRRLALARLLAGRRPLWLLDEPFAALDAEGHALVRALVRSQRNEGGIVICATHEPLDKDAQRVALG